jgi:hypothetical protein
MVKHPTETIVQYDKHNIQQMYQEERTKGIFGAQKKS